jgi:hypothetical protein
MKLEFYRQIFEIYSNIKFYENPSSGSRVVPCGRTDRQRDMTEMIVAFRIFAYALKTGLSISHVNNEGRMADTDLLNTCVCS